MSSATIKRLTRSIGFRLALWYSAIFISSTILLFILIYFPLRSAIMAQDHDMIQAKLKEYAIQNHEAGFRWMLNEIDMEKDHNAENGFLVRVADADNMPLSLTLPAGWQRFDRTRIPSPSSATRGEH